MVKSKNNHQYNWEEVTEKNIFDLAIMNAGGITVPIFTTYAERDYEYILNDCSPSLVIVSNDIQLKR